MKSIETTIVVDESHRASIQLPADVEPGIHRVVVVIERSSLPRAPLSFSAHDVGPWPAGLTLSREEIYDDSGRGA